MRRASFFLVFLCACAGKGPIPGGDKPAWVSTPNGDVRFPADRFVAAVGSVQVGPKETAPELLASVDDAARKAVMSALLRTINFGEDDFARSGFVLHFWRDSTKKAPANRRR